MTGISPRWFVRPFPLGPAVSISGIQSGSIQLPITAPPSPPRASDPFNIFLSVLSRLLSDNFFADIQAVWSSLRISPSPDPVFDEPGFGDGIE